MAPEIAALARMLCVTGIVLLALGCILWLAGHMPGLGRLPGDIVIARERVTVYAPVTTSIVISIVLTLLLNFLARK